MARPRIEDSRRRNRQFGLRTTSGEAALIERAAGRRKMTPTTYIREAAVAAARESEDQPAAATVRLSHSVPAVAPELTPPGLCASRAPRTWEGGDHLPAHAFSGRPRRRDAAEFPLQVLTTCVLPV